MLTHQQIQLIQSSVPILREHGVTLTQHFYHRMLTQHPELKSVFNLGHQRSGAQAQALASAVLAYAEHIEHPEVLSPALDLIAHKHVSLNIQAPDYAIVGENLLASICEVLDVTMDSDLVQAWAAAYGQLAEMLIAAERTLYERQAAMQGSWLGWRRFRIARLVQESQEITSFYLEPVDGEPIASYEPGQYVSVRVWVPELGLKQPRQYSLSDAASSGHYRISVKHEAAKADQVAGWVSHTLHTLRVGDEVELTMPTGNFVLQSADKPNVLISGGVGMTPLVAMLNHLAALDMPQPVHFIHACRDEAVHAMRAHVESLAAKHPRLRSLFYYEQSSSEATSPATIQQGRLEVEQLPASWLPADADYYICGPKPFMSAQYESLRAQGIPEAQIHLEVFSTGGMPLASAVA